MSDRFVAYLMDAVVAKARNPDWRMGQTLFNVLHDDDPELAKRITGSSFDPFYRERGALIREFLNLVYEEWQPDGPQADRD